MPKRVPGGRPFPCLTCRAPQTCELDQANCADCTRALLAASRLRAYRTAVHCAVFRTLSERMPLERAA